MGTTEQIIEAKFLSVCSASEAVEWLRQKREEIGTSRLRRGHWELRNNKHPFAAHLPSLSRGYS